MKFSSKSVVATLAVITVGVLATAAVGIAIYPKNRIKVPAGCERMVFNDEFNVDGLPDSTKWHAEEGYLRNGELQRYTRAGNAVCRNGRLIIELRNDVPDSVNEAGALTSGSLITAGSGAWTYGYVEVRAKVPSSLGVWPSIRLLPADRIYGEWPRSGEIDIMEHVGHNPDKIYFTAHTERFNHVRGTPLRHTLVAPSATDDFHIYGLKWASDRITWFYDGKEQYRLERSANDDWTTWPFDSDFYLSLSLAYGGNWGGVEGVDNSALPKQLEIDYVRIYQ